MAWDLSKAIVAAVEQSELEMMRIIGASLADGIDTSDPDFQWAEIKRMELGRIRRDFTEAMVDSGTVRDQVTQAIERSYARGASLAVNEIAAYTGAQVSYGTTNFATVQALAEASIGRVESMRVPVLRRAVDVYRDTVSETAQLAATGALTRQQASEVTLRKFAERGISGFVDRSGRSWNMTTYAEMTMRTSVGQAAVQGHTDKLQQNGFNLVQVSDAPMECPICRPWEGQRLQIEGSDSIMPTVASARAAGLFHPNCRHSVSLYIRGVSRKPAATDSQRERLNKQTRAASRKTPTPPRVEPPQPPPAREFKEMSQSFRQQEPNWTPGQRKWLEQYRWDSEPVNGPLRSGGRPHVSYRALDSAIQDSPGLDQDTLLYRGIMDKNVQRTFETAEPGTKVVDLGFASTTHREDIAESFRTMVGEGTMLRIKAPKGTKGAYIGDHFPGADQGEFLLARGTEFEVEEVIKHPPKRDSWGRQMEGWSTVVLRIVAQGV